MHMLDSGPELQAVRYWHVIVGQKNLKSGQFIRGFNLIWEFSFIQCEEKKIYYVYLLLTVDVSQTQNTSNTASKVNTGSYCLLQRSQDTFQSILNISIAFISLQVTNSFQKYVRAWGKQLFTFNLNPCVLSLSPCTSKAWKAFSAHSPVLLNSLTGRSK